MPYYYTDKSKEEDEHSLPDVEVFHSEDYWPTEKSLPDANHASYWGGEGFYYAHGSPGCLWDSDPVGPFDSEEEALKEAREA